MARSIRMIAALVLAAAVLDAASWAVKDCSTGLKSYENCLWLSVRGWLRLPESKLLRAGILEGVGLVILVSLWVVFRYVWPERAPTAELNAGTAQKEPGTTRAAP